MVEPNSKHLSCLPHVVIDASGAAGNMRAAAASEPRVPRSMVENAMGKIENRNYISKGLT